MKEKERYVIRYDLDYIRCLIDTEKNQGVGDYIQIVKLLNQQDKENKQLKQKLEEMQNEKNELISKYRYWKGECCELKQQLHDLPKKIVEEIKNLSIFDFEAFEEFKIRRYRITEKALDTILKKYGGEKNEEKTN